MQLVLGSRNAHKLRELSELLHPHELVLLPDTIELPPETATTFARERDRKGLRGGRCGGHGGARRGLGHRRGSAGRRPGRALGALRGRAGNRRAEPRKAAARDRVGDGSQRRLRLRAGVRDPDGDVQLFEGRCEGRLARDPRGAAASATTRSSCRTTDRPPTGRWPSWTRPTRTRSATAAGQLRCCSSGWRPQRRERGAAPGRRAGFGAPPAARLRQRCPAAGAAAAGASPPQHQSRGGQPVHGLELGADRAQDRRRSDHGLDRDHHRGGPLEHRPDRVDRRLPFGAQGGRAGRRRPHVRPREGREPRGGDRGDADPGRRRRDHLRGRRAGWSSAPTSTRSASASPPSRSRPWSTSASPPTSTGRPRLTTRPRSRETPLTCVPTPSPRSRCSSASCWSRSPAWWSSTPMVALVVAVAIVYAGIRILTRSSRVLVDEALPAEELDIVRQAIWAYPGDEIVGYPQAARPPCRQRALHRPPPPVRSRHDARARASDRARAPGRGALRIRGAELLVHLEPFDRVRDEEEKARGRERLSRAARAAGSRPPTSRRTAAPRCSRRSR